MTKFSITFSIKMILKVITLIITIVLLNSTFFTVNAGEKDVLLRFGKITGTYDSGLHFKFPFIDEVIPMSTRITKVNVHGEAASKDLQSVITNIAVNIRINPSKVEDIYQNLKSDYTSDIVGPSMQETFKAVTSQYTAEELITKRALIHSLIFDMASKKLKAYNIILDNVAITNFEFSKAYSESIEQKQIAEQNSKKAEYDYQRIEVEARQTVAKAKAEAEALKLQKEAVTPELVKLREIEVENKAVDKWNGVLPTTTGGVIPFINVK